MTLSDATYKILPTLLSGGALAALIKLVDHIVVRRRSKEAKSTMTNKEFMKATQQSARREMFRRINALEKMVLTCQRQSKFWERKYNQVHDQLVELKADYKIILNQLAVFKAKGERREPSRL